MYLQSIKLEYLQKVQANDYKFLKSRAEDITLTRTEVFKTHRHDQSILSCLQKKSGLYSIWNEIDFAPNWQADGEHFPNWTTRNRTGINFHKHNLYDFPDRAVNNYRIFKHQTKYLLKKIFRQISS